MMDIILASNNQKKLNEMQSLLSPLSWNVISQKAFELESVKETGLSFVENALLKARHASAHANLPALADDSGICIPALCGAPGIYSSRYAGEDATDKDNNLKLLSDMQLLSGDQRIAYFFCSLVFVEHANDPTPLIVSAKWYGRITEKEIGGNGFGYDPLFFVDDFLCTSAQLSSSIKNSISHRGQAMQQLLAKLQADSKHIG